MDWNLGAAAGEAPERSGEQERQEEMASGCTRGGFCWMLGKVSRWKGLCSPGTASQGSDGVLILGGISEPCACGTWGRGLGVALAVMGPQWLDSMISESFSNPNDSLYLSLYKIIFLYPVSRQCIQYKDKHSPSDCCQKHLSVLLSCLLKY